MSCERAVVSALVCSIALLDGGARRGEQPTAIKPPAPEPDAQEARSRARRSPHVVSFDASAVNASAPHELGAAAERRDACVAAVVSVHAV
jgi:hypothetical protein